MNYEEFKEHDVFNIFDNFTSIELAEETGLIPESYKGVFPKRCKCGSDIIISDNLTNIRCCDPRCYIKEGHKLSEMLVRFGVKNWGPSTCIDLMWYLLTNKKVISHIEVLRLNRGDLIDVISVPRANELLIKIGSILNNRYSFAELMSKMAIPTLEKTSYKIFGDISSSNEAFGKMYEAGGIGKYLEQKGIHNKATAYYIKTYLSDIKIAGEIFQDKIMPSAKRRIDVVMTGELYPNGERTTKKNYIRMLNDKSALSNGIQVYEFVESSSKMSAPYVVADYASFTDKYKTGLARGVLINSTDLLKILEERMEQIENEFNEQ